MADLEEHGRVERDPETADRLCAALGYLLLGIELVGSYLRHDRYRTIAEVIGSLQEKGMQDLALVRSDEDDLLAERGVKAALDLTWETLEPEAQRVARSLSYFALDWIQWDFAERVMQRVEGETYELGGLKARLENASLVQFEQEAPGWSRLHPLIRQYLREVEDLVVRETGEAAFRSAYVSVMSEIASQMPDNPPTKAIKWFEGVRSHVQEVAEQYTEGLQGDDLLGSFVSLARFYAGQELYLQAEEWYAECLNVTESRFQGDHRDVALSRPWALLYHAQGRLSEAELLYVRSVEMRQRLFEGDHPDVALSLWNLGAFRFKQGRLQEAEALLVQAFEMYQRVLGNQHPRTVATLQRLQYVRSQM